MLAALCVWRLVLGLMDLSWGVPSRNPPMWRDNVLPTSIVYQTQAHAFGAHIPTIWANYIVSETGNKPHSFLFAICTHQTIKSHHTTFCCFIHPDHGLVFPSTRLYYHILIDGNHCQLGLLWPMAGDLIHVNYKIMQTHITRNMTLQ